MKQSKEKTSENFRCYIMNSNIWKGTLIFCCVEDPEDESVSKSHSGFRNTISVSFNKKNPNKQTNKQTKKQRCILFFLIGEEYE